MNYPAAELRGINRLKPLFLIHRRMAVDKFTHPQPTKIEGGGVEGKSEPDYQDPLMTYRIDPDIERQKDLFLPEEYQRLLGYLQLINAVSREETYPHNNKPTGGRIMSKTVGEVLGKDFDDYFTLTSRLQ